MPLKAVKFAPENFSLILDTDETVFPPLTIDEVESWYRASLDAGKTYYYTPRFNRSMAEPSFWRFFSEEAFEELFTYDKDKIKTEFVEITRK